MARYRAAEPVPFLQRTQEWASKAGADEGVAAAEKSPVAGLSEKDLPKEEDTFVTVTSHVLGVSAERIKARAELMRDTARVDSELAKGIAWEDLALDVAFMNSDVRAARERWKATLYQYSQADYLEGLLREYRTFTRYLDVPTGEPLQKEMAQNFVPSPGVVAMKGEMIREEARLDELEWERTLRDAVIETGTLFFDYQYQFRAAQATRENVTLLENLVKVVDDRYQAGISSQADLLKAQTELERQRNALKDFEARQRADAGQINAALTRPSETPLGPPRGAGIVYAAVTVDLLTKTALDGRQEVNMAKAKVGRTEVAIRMGEVMNRPPFSQGYSTFERGMMPEASAGMPNMPVGFRPSDVVRP
ncbi:MAG: TolC family protein, partial [Candidatus Hydrogenedentes bacterium]|nr:TolC family protein [Candidatus Hydrogenedentota bacterium]